MDGKGRIPLRRADLREAALRARESGTAAEKAEALRKLEDFACGCKADGITQFRETRTVETHLERWSAPLK